MNGQQTRASHKQELGAAWLRYAVLLCGVGLVVAIISIVTWPPPWALGTLVLPGFETAFGFRGGPVPQGPDSTKTIYGFAAVVPTGRLAEAGVKPGDIPVEGDDLGLLAFYEALEAATAGHEGQFAVVSDFQAFRRTGAVRRVVLKPINRVQ
jgi:hypothetical protein